MGASADTTRQALTAVLLGNASSADHAAEMAGQMQGCPYVTTYRAEGAMVIGIFALPPDKRWWIELTQERPELLGLERVAVLVTERVRADSPWTVESVQPVAERAPCGSDCPACPQYGDRCAGCPATVHYEAKGNQK